MLIGRRKAKVSRRVKDDPSLPASGLPAASEGGEDIAHAQIRIAPHPNPSHAEATWRGKYLITDIMAEAKQRSSGYAEFVLACGTVEGNFVVLDAKSFRDVREKFPLPGRHDVPLTPSAAELAANFAGAMSTWAKAGFKVVERDVYEKRNTICSACEYWLPHGHLGLGKCRKCGCSRVKLWLATSKCPDTPPRW